LCTETSRGALTHLSLLSAQYELLRAVNNEHERNTTTAIFVSQTFQTTLIIKRGRQQKVVRDAPQDISGRHQIKQGDSELWYYHAKEFIQI
jgi:hypothetical protein